MSEPEDDMPCSDMECCKEKKQAAAAENRESSPLRKLVIKEEHVESSPLKDFDDKISPLRESIHKIL